MKFRFELKLELSFVLESVEPISIKSDILRPTLNVIERM
jgi:hypothetical protein